MADLLTWVHAMSGVIVLAEALNKLERSDPLRRGLDAHQRASALLKAMAWMLLALGAAGAIIAPIFIAMGAEKMAMHGTVLMRMDYPTLAETCVLAGFATLIIRTRVKEG